MSNLGLGRYKGSKIYIESPPGTIRELKIGAAARGRPSIDPAGTHDPSGMVPAGKAPPARERLISMLGGKCAECGDADLNTLEIDHIHNDGAARRREHGGSNLAEYYWLLRHPDETARIVQLLCFVCHKIKTRDEREAARTKSAEARNKEQNIALRKIHKTPA